MYKLKSLLSRSIISSFSKVNYSPSFRAATVEVDYEIHGFPITLKTKPPLLILHGLFATKNEWVDFSKSIAGDITRPVVTMDIRNHGDSPHTRTHTYEDIVGDAEKLVDKLKVGKVILLGHGMGGKAAMVFALTKPEKIAGLVVIDTIPLPGDKTDYLFNTLVDAMQNTYVDNSDLLAVARKRMRSDLQKQIYHEIDNDIVDWKNQQKKKKMLQSMLDVVVLNLAKDYNRQIGWKVNINTLKEFYSTDIDCFPNELLNHQYYGPALFIAATKSGYVRNRDLLAIQQYFPKAEIKYIKSGHNIHIEEPDILITTVTNFINKKLNYAISNKHKGF